MTEMMKKHLEAIVAFRKSIRENGTIPENEWGYCLGDNPFIDYILSDKSSFPKASDCIDPRTGKNYIDKDDDFLIGHSGGLLMNIEFVLIGTDKFSRVADFYDTHKKYTLEYEESDEYYAFFRREMDRRRKGVIGRCKLMFDDIPVYLSAKTDEERKNILKPLRITGDNYNYLNYGRLERTPNDAERAAFNKVGLDKVETIDGFPRMWDGDYWNFKIDEFIGINKFHLCKSKARRKGFSYKRGSQAANTLNAIKNVTVTLAADNLDFLTDKGATSYMTKTNLDWYEIHTGWSRGYLSENYKSGIELGYKQTKQGQKGYGWRSKLLSIACGKNESAAVGKKAIETDFEEAGKFPKLQEALNVMLSNSESGAVSVGTIRVYGTGGTKGANWAAFQDIFYNPRKNMMLEMENVWDINKRHTTCGFFFPQIWNYEPFVEDSNSLLFDAWVDDKRKKEFAREANDSTDYNIYVGQRANTPAEAFVSTQENMYHSIELTQHIHNLENDNAYKFYRDGWYVLDDVKGVKFITKEESYALGNVKIHDYIRQVPHTNRTDVHGCVREFYPPIPNNGDLYFIAADTYRVNKTIASITLKHSLYCFQVYMYKGRGIMRPQEGKLVATYCGRLNSMEENDRLLYLACLRWNAKVLIEAGTGETVPNFKKWHAKKFLLRDPSHYIDRTSGHLSSDTYGIVVGDGEKKMEGLRMVKDMVYEVIGYDDESKPKYYLQSLYDLATCYELDRFNSTGNFDRLSTMIVAAFEFEKDAIIRQRKIRNSSNATGKAGRKIDRLINC